MHVIPLPIDLPLSIWRRCISLIACVNSGNYKNKPFTLVRCVIEVSTKCFSHWQDSSGKIWLQEFAYR